MATDAPYPELKKTHTMARRGRPWRDYKPPPSGPVWAVIQGVGIALLAVPLVFLFLAALARSARMRRGFILIAIVGPAFIGLGTIVSAGTLVSSSGDWEGDATKGVAECFQKAAESDQGATGATGATGAKGPRGSDRSCKKC